MTDPDPQLMATLRQELGYTQKELGKTQATIERLETLDIDLETLGQWKWRRRLLNSRLRTTLFELFKNGQLELT